MELPPDFNLNSKLLNKIAYDENDLDDLEEMHNSKILYALIYFNVIFIVLDVY